MVGARDSAAAEAAVDSYLRLGCEGIGLGYLFPAESGRESFFTLAWNRLLPRGLPGLPPARRAEVLAACWNLGENLESQPAWLRRLFHRVCRSLDRLDDLEGLVARVARDALEPPAVPLGERPRVAWIDLGAEDRRFLPGALHFVAPQVLCVHARAGAGAIGVLLSEPPLVLGPMGCAENPAAQAPDEILWLTATGDDPRWDEPLAFAANPWRAASTLTTSQQVVALLPAAGAR